MIKLLDPVSPDKLNSCGNLFDDPIDKLDREKWEAPVDRVFVSGRMCKVCRKPITLNPLYGGCHC